jgi:hypothetical protein
MAYEELCRDTSLLGYRPIGIYTHALWHPETHESDYQFRDVRFAFNCFHVTFGYSFDLLRSAF